MENIKISIPKKLIADLPKVTFDGEITLIDKPEQVSEAIAALEKESVIGFDTETKPSFKKGKPNKVALMQLSTMDHCYLFRLNKLGIKEDLCRLLENKDIKKIGLSVHDDFNVMHRSSEVNPQGFVELQNMVKEYCIEDISLQRVYAIIFGKKISKTQRLTNWEAVTLTRQQQVYAATDAWACLQIYHHLLEGKFRPEESEYILYDEPEVSNPDSLVAETVETVINDPEALATNDNQNLDSPAKKTKTKRKPKTDETKTKKTAPKKTNSQKAKSIKAETGDSTSLNTEDNKTQDTSDKSKSGTRRKSKKSDNTYLQL